MTPLFQVEILLAFLQPPLQVKVRLRLGMWKGMTLFLWVSQFFTISMKEIMVNKNVKFREFLFLFNWENESWMKNLLMKYLLHFSMKINKLHIKLKRILWRLFWYKFCIIKLKIQWDIRRSEYKSNCFCSQSLHCHWWVLMATRISASASEVQAIALFYSTRLFSVQWTIFTTLSNWREMLKL